MPPSHHTQRWVAVLLFAFVIMLQARITAFAQTPRFSTDTPDVINSPGNSLFISLPLINSGTGAASNVQITSITLSSATLLNPTALPFLLADIRPSGTELINATFDSSGLLANHNYLLTVRGTYVTNNTISGFAVNRFILVPSIEQVTATTSKTITPDGGQVQIADVITIELLKNQIQTPIDITLQQVNSPSQIALFSKELLQNSQPPSIASTFIRIETSDLIQGAMAVRIKVPPEVLNTLGQDQVPEVYAEVINVGADEEVIGELNPLNAQYDTSTNILTTSLSSNYFNSISNFQSSTGIKAQVGIQARDSVKVKASDTSQPFTAAIVVALRNQKTKILPVTGSFTTPGSPIIDAGPQDTLSLLGDITFTLPSTLLNPTIYLLPGAVRLPDGVFSRTSRPPHLGLDLQSADGDPIFAAASGKAFVTFQPPTIDPRTGKCFETPRAPGKCRSGGFVIQITSEDGSVTGYGHLLLNSNVVNTGDHVNPGDLIAQADSTGGVSGPHLHLSYALYGMPKTDPLPFLSDTPSQMLIQQYLDQLSVVAVVNGNVVEPTRRKPTQLRFTYSAPLDLSGLNLTPNQTYPLVINVETDSGQSVPVYSGQLKIRPVSQLTITKSGTGVGTVASVPAGINCGPTCSTQSALFLSDSLVQLTAAAEPGSTFVGWGGDCAAAGTGLTAQVSVTSNKTCTAIFNAGVPNCPPGVICGKVTDAETDTVLLQGIILELRSAQGAVIRSTSTNNSGLYSFTSVAPGSYFVSPAVGAGQGASPSFISTSPGSAPANFKVRGVPAIINVFGTRPASLALVTDREWNGASPPPFPSPFPAYTVTTDGSGNGLLRVAPGSYWLTCFVPNPTVFTKTSNWQLPRPPDTPGRALKAQESISVTCPPLPPSAPVLVSEETSTRAIASDSVVWLRDPLQLNSPIQWGVDRRTRVTLFAMNFDLLPGESISVVAADAEDAAHHIYPLTVEYVGKIQGLDWLSYVVVRLNDNMGDIGDVLVRLTVRGVSSNRVRLGIGHIGGGPPDDLGAAPTPGRPPQ